MIHFIAIPHTTVSPKGTVKIIGHARYTRTTAALINFGTKCFGKGKASSPDGSLNDVVGTVGTKSIIKLAEFFSATLAMNLEDGITGTRRGLCNSR